jgi:hypothetical protein
MFAPKYRRFGGEGNGLGGVLAMRKFYDKSGPWPWDLLSWRAGPINGNRLWRDGTCVVHKSSRSGGNQGRAEGQLESSRASLLRLVRKEFRSVLEQLVERIQTMTDFARLQAAQEQVLDIGLGRTATVALRRAYRRRYNGGQALDRYWPPGAIRATA